MSYRYTTFGLMLSLLLLAGCSSTTFVYNRLDFIVPWYVDDYVQLDRTQKELLDDLLQPQLKWHREQELPRYLTIITEIQQSLSQETQLEDVARYSLQVEEALDRIGDAMFELTLALGEQLNDVQIESFLETLHERQSENEDEFLSRTDKEYTKDVYESLLDSYQDYLGRLDKDQRQILKLAAAEFERFDKVWLAERVDWLKQYRKILQREEGWQLRLREARMLRDKNRSPEYSDTYENNMRLVRQTIATVLNSRSKKQERRLRRKLESIREDIESLIADTR